MRLPQLALTLSAVAVGGLALALAHEGHSHDSIKAKGITTDAEGRLVLDIAARKAIGLATARADLGDLDEELVVTGRVLIPPDRRAFASTRVPGFVTEVLVRPGDTVEAGQPLGHVQSVELVRLLQEVLSAELELALAQANLERVQALGEAVVTGTEVIGLEAERDERRSALALLRKELEALGNPAGALVPILSPIGGRVVDVDATAGASVDPAQHLFEVHDLSEVWVALEVPESDVASVQAGQHATVRFPALPELEAAGPVERLAPELDVEHHARKVLVRVQSPDPRLAGGMSAIARVVLNRIQGAVIAPRSAIVTSGAERHVFVEESPGLLRRRAIVVGARAGERVEVWSGVDPGALLVTKGNHELASLFVKGTLELDATTREAIGYQAGEVELRSVEDAQAINAVLELPTGRRSVASARIEGKVARLHVTLGDTVEADQPLAEVESLSLLREQLALIRLVVRLGLAERQLGLLQGAPSAAVARKDVLRLESEVARLGAEVASTRSRLVLLGLTEEEVGQVVATGESVGRVVLRAPMAGTVSSVVVELGQVVRSGDPVVTVVASGRLWATGAFLEPDVPVLPSRGTSTVVRAVSHPDREWSGPLTIVEASLAGSARALRASVELEDSDGVLLPGMQATLWLSRETPPELVVAVPLAALLDVGGAKVAYVEREGTDAFERVEVEVGRRGATHAEARRGLFPGDRVVVGGVRDVNNQAAAVR